MSGDGIPPVDTLNGLGAPVRFAEIEPDEAYEVFIRRTAQVPTRRDNWHDFFNALAWLSFPKTKAALNRLHCEQIERAGGVSGNRGTARDLLSLFDEGGVIVASADPGLLGLMQSFEWKALFWERRAEVIERMRFFVFGHAILEKALEPYKGVTAKALPVMVPDAFLTWSLEGQLKHCDAEAAAWFEKPGVLDSTRNLSPLPLMGIPGWADNASETFYDDARVFRPGYAPARA